MMILPEWTDRAACAGTATSYWFRKEGEGRSSGEYVRTRQAKAWCERCPVRRECLTYAYANERPEPGRDGGRAFTISRTPPFGIYGGFTARERHHPNVKHREACDRRCKVPGGCRRDADRVALLLGDETEEEAS